MGGLLAGKLAVGYREINIFSRPVHYGKYAALYLKKTLFFDSNPSLGKMLIAIAGYLAGFDGRFSFDKIGHPSHCGFFLSPTVYLISNELKLGPYSGALALLMVLLDTAILAQSRFILIESIMMMCVVLRYSDGRGSSHQQQVSCYTYKNVNNW